MLNPSFLRFLACIPLVSVALYIVAHLFILAR
jgi:hypothetical protein